MKLSKEFIEGYIYRAIKLSDFDIDLNVRATVYFIELSQDFQVELNWNTGYDNAKDEEVPEIAKFSISNDLPDFEKFEKLFIDKLDEIAMEGYDVDYDSRQAEMEFREEQKFESNRGN